MTKKIDLFPSYKIKRNLDYAFTISPKADLTHLQYESTAAFLYKLIPYCSFNLFPELTDINRGLHFHGTIRFKHYPDIMYVYDLIKDFQEDFAIEIDSIEDWYWYFYCRKSRQMMNGYMRSHKLLSYFSDNELFNQRRTITKYFVNTQEAFQSLA